MKIIHKYVLREHAGPLVFALSALTSLMLLNYIAKQLGNLVGKGLPWTAILEFFVLSLPFTVAMTLPMAVLVAVLYAFSRLAAENEITALKANGVSMTSLLLPVMAGGAVLALVMIVFNDQVLPRTNHRLRTLQGDIARKKPTFALREQVINEVAPGRFFLRTNHLDRATNLMREVTIYDLSDPLRRRTIYADSGMMAFTPGGADLQLTLFDGYMQEVPKETPTQLQRLYYRVDLVKVPGVANAFERDSSDSYKSDREMSVCELQNEVARYEVDYFRAHDEYYRAQSVSSKNPNGTIAITASSGLPSLTPGARAPRSRQRSFGRTYCDFLAFLERQGAGKLTLLGAADAVRSIVEPRSAWAQGTQAGQARDTLKTRADTLRVRADSLRADSLRADSLRADSLRADSLRAQLLRTASSTALRDSVRQDSVRRDSLRRDSVGRAAAAQPPLPPPTTIVPPPQALPPGVTVVNGDTIYPGNPNASPSAAPGMVPVLPNGSGTPMATLSPTIPASVAMETARSSMLQARSQMDQYAVEIHKKFAISLACIVFVLLGAPIALRFPRGGVGLTIGVSLVVFSLYYVGLIAGEALGDRAIVSPFLAMQLANILFTLVGLLLLARMGRESATSRGGDLSELMESITGMAKGVTRVFRPRKKESLA